MFAQLREALTPGLLLQISIRKTSFPERVVRHWNRMSREVMESASLEVFKSCVDVAPGDVARFSQEDYWLLNTLTL